MSIVTNGSIEPVLAIQDAVHELYGALALFVPLNHIFASYHNTILAFECKELSRNYSDTITKQYFDVICKKIDLSNLDLSVNNELLLRRNGISTIGNLISMPLSVLKSFGLKNKEFLELKVALNKFGFWKEIDKKDWESFEV